MLLALGTEANVNRPDRSIHASASFGNVQHRGPIPNRRRRVWHSGGLVATNDRLQRAITNNKLSRQSLARAVNVGERAVGTWIRDGVIPQADTKYQVAALLSADVDYLWPPAEQTVDESASEVITTWPRRADCPADYWWRLFQTATTNIDVLGYAVLFLTEQHPDLLELLIDRADNGCQIRIVLANPHAPATRERDQEEGLDGSLIARINASIKYLRPLQNTSAQLRYQTFPMYNSIFRFDNDMLVTPHLALVPGKLSPMFHFRRVHNGGLFDRFALHFTNIYGATTPIPTI